MLLAQCEVVQQNFYAYKLNATIEKKDSSFYKDTVTDNFHNFLPQQKTSYNTLGFMNPGNPFVTAIFSEQQKTNTFRFLNNYYPYIQNHNDILYFDTKNPYTVFGFNGGGKIFENLKFLHTQNINPSLNFAFKYDILNTQGCYMFNKTNVHSLSLAVAYTKHKYQNRFNFIFNKIKNQENGGIADYSIFENTSTRSENINVNLHDAKNNISQLGFQTNQEYRFGNYITDTIYQEKDTVINKVVNSNLSIVHDFIYDRFYRVYNDIMDLDSAGMSPILDSTALHFASNRLYMKYSKKLNDTTANLQILTGLKNNYYFYSIENSKNKHSSTFISGIVNYKTNSSNFNGEINYGILGRERFDIELIADYYWNILKSLELNTYLNFDFKKPDFILTNYKSSLFNWDNSNFSKTKKTSIGANLKYLPFNVTIGTNLNILYDYIIFDSIAIPKQISKTNIVGDVFINNKLKFGYFNWFNQLSYQYILDRENIPLPEYVLYSNFYFQKQIFHGAMTLQLGIDTKYSSTIYGYAYMPATGAFYLQEQKQTGNYPNASVYCSFKVKQLRAFAKAGNINSTFMNRTYYLLDRIPDNPFVINFGISWVFFD